MQHPIVLHTFLGLRMRRVTSPQLVGLRASYPGVAVALPDTVFSSAFKMPLPALAAAAATTEEPDPELPPELEVLAELEVELVPDPDTGGDFAAVEALPEGFWPGPRRACSGFLS